MWSEAYTLKYSCQKNKQKNNHHPWTAWIFTFNAFNVLFTSFWSLAGTFPLNRRPLGPFSAPVAVWVQTQWRMWWWQWATQRSNWGRGRRRRRGAAWSSSLRKEKGRAHWTANGGVWALAAGWSCSADEKVLGKEDFNYICLWVVVFFSCRALEWQ